MKTTHKPTTTNSNKRKFTMDTDLEVDKQNKKRKIAKKNSNKRKNIMNTDKDNQGKKLKYKK
jgi:hypothetical protein